MFSKAIMKGKSILLNALGIIGIKLKKQWTLNNKGGIGGILAVNLWKEGKENAKVAEAEAITEKNTRGPDQTGTKIILEIKTSNTMIMFGVTEILKKNKLLKKMYLETQKKKETIEIIKCMTKINHQKIESNKAITIIEISITFLKEKNRKRY